MTTTRTEKQNSVAQLLASEFKIDAERVYFLKPDKPEEPWLPAESLVTIARQSGEFRAIDESFDQFIEPLHQVVHRATVIDQDGRTYTRSGVATVGERAANSAQREVLDEHALAAGRAVSAALTAAGFNPLRPGSVIPLDSRRGGAQADAAGADEAQSRNTDLKRIHALAVEKGLIRMMPGGGRDLTEYRRMLREKFNANTAADFSATQRASLINYLTQLPVEIDEFADVA